MSNSAPLVFLASYLLVFIVTGVIGGLLFKLGFCNLDDKSKYPLGTAAPATAISEPTPLVNADL